MPRRSGTHRRHSQMPDHRVCDTRSDSIQRSNFDLKCSQQAIALTGDGLVPVLWPTLTFDIQSLASPPARPPVQEAPPRVSHNVVTGPLRLSWVRLSLT